jgi:hypothetical protein
LAGTCRIGALSMLVALTATGAAWAGATDAYYERAVMVAADTRCRLFTPDVAAALQAGKAQARGAALRGGATAEQLAQIEAKARSKAAAAGCQSADIRKAADRVRGAFDGYRKLQRLDLPGELQGWRASKPAPSKGRMWRLSQTTRAGADPVVFGLYAGQSSGLAAAASFADGAAPYSARVVVRDPARASGPYLRGWRANGRTPLAQRTAPPVATRAFLAQGREPADPLLMPQARRPLLFLFPEAALPALAALDPREAVTLEFLVSTRSGDQVRRAYVEVGDLAAGLAFLKTG